MLDDGFVAKASSLKARPSLLCLEAQINDRNVFRIATFYHSIRGLITICIGTTKPPSSIPPVTQHMICLGSKKLPSNIPYVAQA